MKYRLLLILTFLPLSVDSYDFIEIPHTAAIQNVGKLRTVCGKVQSTYINSNTASQRIYLKYGSRISKSYIYRPNMVFIK